MEDLNISVVENCSQVAQIGDETSRFDHSSSNFESWTTQKENEIDDGESNLKKNEKCSFLKV